ncbi:MAG: hypothetical protein ACI3ZP_01910, partial [Candidatus Cryptobacteroides sp.]
MRRLSRILLLVTFALSVALPLFSQEAVPAAQSFKLKSEIRQERRDSIRAHKKVWVSVLGGPSYTPE